MVVYGVPREANWMQNLSHRANRFASLAAGTSQKQHPCIQNWSNQNPERLAQLRKYTNHAYNSHRRSAKACRNQFFLRWRECPLRESLDHSRDFYAWRHSGYRLDWRQCHRSEKSHRSWEWIGQLSSDVILVEGLCKEQGIRPSH